MVLKNYKLLLVMLLSILCTRASAYDFAVQNSDEVTIYYEARAYDTNLGSYVARVIYKSYNNATNCSEGYEGVTTLNIPEKVTYNDVEYTVTSIGNYAFFGCSGLTSVTIPSSVTHIYNSAFSNCIGLTSVIIPNSVKSIGQSVFDGCNGLTSVTIPNSVTSIDIYMFRGCIGLTSVTIPSSVTSIGGSAFRNCSSLTVTIPNSVTSIGENAFYGVESLEFEATEPIALTAQIIGSKSTVIYVPQSALDAYRSADVWSDAKVNIIAKEAQHAFDVETPVLSTIGPNQFENVVSLKLSGNVGSEDVMYIRNKMYNLQHLDLTDAVFVESTEEYASGKKIHAGQCGGFYELLNLRSVKLPTSTGTIEGEAFRNCYYLRNVTFPVGIRYIGSSVFYNCANLRSAVLPEGLKTIGGSAFRECSRLKSVAFPSTLVTIQYGAFYYCI